MPDLRRHAILAVLFAVIACSRSQVGVEGGVPADAGGDDMTPALDVAPAFDGLTGADADLAPGQCRFAVGESGSLQSAVQIIHQVSERLSAPPGGLWWLAAVVTGSTVVAQRDALPPVVLEVVRPNPVGTVTRVVGAVLRVPADLAPGSRLRLDGRELVVTAAETKLSFDDIRISFAYRPDLGGTGVSVHIPPAKRSRVMIAQGFVGPLFANVGSTTQVLAGLSMADAPRMCAPAAPADAAEIFVPMWTGEIRSNEGLILGFVDVDDLANGLGGRLCQMPSGDASANVRCQVQLPP
jgi:hypothetical protein